MRVTEKSIFICLLQCNEYCKAAYKCLVYFRVERLFFLFKLSLSYLTPLIREAL